MAHDAAISQEFSSEEQGAHWAFLTVRLFISILVVHLHYSRYSLMKFYQIYSEKKIISSLASSLRAFCAVNFASTSQCAAPRRPQCETALLPAVAVIPCRCTGRQRDPPACEQQVGSSAGLDELHLITTIPVYMR